MGIRHVYSMFSMLHVFLAWVAISRGGDMGLGQLLGPGVCESLKDLVSLLVMPEVASA